jgi:small nuclear ribonucleoprotein (snRNP)-like protein
MLSWFSDRSRTRDMVISTCSSHAVMTFGQKSHPRHDNINRQHVTNMLMLSCLVCDFCRKVMTAYDQHVNVIMCRVRLLSESDGSMWTTSWYYHMLSWLSDRSRTPDMITLPCWSHAVVTFRQKSYTRHDNINMLVTCCRDFPTMLMLSCVVCDFCRKVTAACDQHVNVIMSRVRLLSESYDSMWPTPRHDNINMLVTCCRHFPTEVAHDTW